jgi:4-amino-4-deoxy-L-arabinose transferase-like glycosyltransferase
MTESIGTRLECPRCQSPPRGAASEAKPYELWLVILILGLLAAQLIADAFARTELVFNEAQYWSWSRELDFGYFSKPPLIAWLIRGTSELCGNSEACLRSFPPVLNAIATWFVFLTGRALYGVRAGFWSAIVFDTLPLIAFLAASVTPDVPLLLFWSIALYLWTMLIERKSMAWSVLLGLAVGVGLLAKYAMIYFPLCMACQAIFSAEARETLRGKQALVIVLVALIVIAPNLYWNYVQGFVTFDATANSAGWDRQAEHLTHFVRFLLSQFLVYGPVLFFMVLWIAVAAIRGRADSRITDSRVVMLLAFSLPILILITVQSLIARTHASWTAAIAPAASILVTAWLLERRRRILFGATVATNALAAAAMLIGPALPPGVYPAKSDPFLRMSGWKGIAASVRRELAKNGYRALAVDGRDLAAELLYYLRDSNVPLYAIKHLNKAPTNHFELMRPYRGRAPEPVLFASLRPQSGALDQFRSVTFLGSETILGGGRKGRTLRFYSVSGFLGKGDGMPCRANPRLLDPSLIIRELADSDAGAGHSCRLRKFNPNLPSLPRRDAEHVTR